jgi:glycerol-3-phosphate dehydrogenase
LRGTTFDLAIIGGGMSGTAIARDAAGRGLSVYLCEEGDLAGGASSNGGGIALNGVPGDLSLLARRGTRTDIAEAEMLLRCAPHAAHAIRVVMPRCGGVRGQLRRFSVHMHRRGAGETAAPPITLELQDHPSGRMLKSNFRFADEFSGYAVDEARVAILNALDARARTAVISPRSRCFLARREGWFWKLTIESETGEITKIAARALVNAAGARAGDVLTEVVHDGAAPEMLLVRRSYIAIRRVFDRERALALPLAGGRSIFALPLDRDLTVVGPSEAGHVGDAMAPAASIADVEYLLDAISDYLQEPVGKDAVVFTYAAVDAMRAGGAPGSSRADGEFERDMPDDLAPLVSVFGVPAGRHRRMAEQVVEAFRDHLRIGRRWTADAVFPGGHFPINGADELVRAIRVAYPFVTEPEAERMVGTHGSRATAILSGARRPEDLGARFGDSLSEAEVRFLMDDEWAQTAGDVVWRRTRLGLTMSPADVARLDDWMRRARAPRTAAGQTAA